MTASRRRMLRFAEAGIAATAVPLPGRALWAQVKEEAENEPATRIRKGIDKYLDVINVDLLEAEAKTKLTNG